MRATTLSSVAAVLVPVAGAVRFRHRGGLAVVALLSTATTWGLSLSHALEMPPKRALPLERWWWLTRTLYRPWFGRAGHVEGVALMAVPLLAVIDRRRDAAVAATALLIANPVLFTSLVAPTNAATLREEMPPPSDLRRLRDRWEYGHLARCVCHGVALVALATGRQ